jgi:CYTH domain-containing protein/predicted ATPase
MQNVSKIVLTGGPCSGKTKAIRKLKEYYEKKDYTVFVCPESATVALQQGISRDNMAEFEIEIAKIQNANEDDIDNNIKLTDNDKIIVFYDRGITDCFSYLNNNEKLEFERKINDNIYNSWSRYDAVLFLETTALSDNYANNTYRIENNNEAVSCHNSLLDVWIGHPHLRYFKNEDSFDIKFNKMISEIDCVVNNVEQEIKLLIEYPNLDMLKKYNPFKAEIEQVYLYSTNGSHRIRKRCTNGVNAYFETVKIRVSGDKCIEYENIISCEEYCELLKEADENKHPIIKNRYCFLYQGQYFELDIYSFWNDKATLELELASENQQYVLPPEIKVIKDVSKSKKYKNSYLAGLEL